MCVHARSFAARYFCSALAVERGRDSFCHLHRTHPQEYQAEHHSPDQTPTEPRAHSDTTNTHRQTRPPHAEVPMRGWLAVVLPMHMLVHDRTYHRPFGTVYSAAQSWRVRDLIL